MTKVLVISPHLDDAILSVGEMIASTDEVTVLTMFSGSPKNPMETDYDKKCGFANSDEANKERKNEDESACRTLNADYVHLDFLESQYREKQYDGFEIESSLKEYVELSDVIYFPEGIVHPDHEIVFSIVSHLYKNHREEKKFFVYEDLPYRIIYPEVSVGKIQNSPIFENAYLHQPFKNRIKKIKAVKKYKSQVGTGDIVFENILVPERYWELQ